MFIDLRPILDYRVDLFAAWRQRCKCIAIVHTDKNIRLAIKR
jgi:hypothetical protein